MPPTWRSEAAITVDLLVQLARIGGIELSQTRSASLVPQAEAHFTLMQAVDALDPRGAEIASEFSLDSMERGE